MPPHDECRFRLCPMSILKLCCVASLFRFIEERQRKIRPRQRTVPQPVIWMAPTFTFCVNLGILVTYTASLSSLETDISILSSACSFTVAHSSGSRQRARYTAARDRPANPILTATHDWAATLTSLHPITGHRASRTPLHPDSPTRVGGPHTL